MKVGYKSDRMAMGELFFCRSSRDIYEAFGLSAVKMFFREESSPLSILSFFSFKKAVLPV